MARDSSWAIFIALIGLVTLGLTWISPTQEGIPVIIGACMLLAGLIGVCAGRFRQSSGDAEAPSSAGGGVQAP